MGKEMVVGVGVRTELGWKNGKAEQRAWVSEEKYGEGKDSGVEGIQGLELVGGGVCNREGIEMFGEEGRGEDIGNYCIAWFPLMRFCFWHWWERERER